MSGCAASRGWRCIFGVAARRVVRGWRFVPVSLAGSAGYSDICAFLHWSCVGWLEMMAHLEVPVSWVIRGGWLCWYLRQVVMVALVPRGSCAGCCSGCHGWRRIFGFLAPGEIGGCGMPVSSAPGGCARRQKLGRTSVCPPYCARIFAISRVRRINLRLSVKES